MIIGIDLGTTNSLVSYWDGEQPRIISNILGERMTPSVVGVDDDGQILVGSVAYERLATHPDKTAAGFKRYMGTDKIYSLGQHEFSPIDLSHYILKSLKEDAEAYLNCRIDEAVIGVPAYFNDSQRKATKQAAELAGLRVERLVTEPTAAALAYGLHRDKEYTKFLVFDLGGGTFDVSVLELFEGIMEVRAVAGDNHLGGNDFNALLTSLFCEHNGIKPDDADPRLLALIEKQVERAKKRLSDASHTTVSCQFNDRTFELSVSRQEADELFAPLYRRLRVPMESVLRDTNIMPDELDAVLLVGGATRMPYIRTMVARMFGKMPYCNLNPDEAVAMGAAVQAALKARDESLGETVMTDVCPFTLGTDISRTDKNGHILERGVFSPIIERNTVVPVSRIKRYYALNLDQKELNFGIYQGENRNVQNNVKIGEIEVPIPSNGKDRQYADVRFTYDVNGLLEVEVVVLSTGLTKKLIIEKTPGTMTPLEIEKRLAELAGIKVHPRDRTENRLLLAKGERLYEELTGENRTEIDMAITNLNQALETQNDHLIRKAAAEAKKVFSLLERRFDLY